MISSYRAKIISNGKSEYNCYKIILGLIFIALILACIAATLSKIVDFLWLK